MVPRVSDRGHSFKGASKYYLNPKKGEEEDRVDWSHCVNLPSDCPEEGFRQMAFTAIHRDELKRMAGVPLTGRKSTAGVVYSYSLAWAPEQDPDQETMKSAALDTLDVLGLSDHEAVLVAHNDRPHKHVHIICNLVGDDGRIKNLQKDHLALSRWAEAFEKHHGQIYCHNRVINNQLRDEKDASPMTIKYKEKELDKKALIQSLYSQSDCGKSFSAALIENGFTLAKGDRRGVVLVDQEGTVSSLTKQLKGQRTTDIKARLTGLGELPKVSDVVHQSKHFDRDKYEAERQMEIVDAAIKEDQKNEKQIKNAGQKKKTHHHFQSNDRPDKEPFYKEVDDARQKEQAKDQAMWRLKNQQESFYQRKKLLEKLDEINGLIERNIGGNIIGRKKQLEEMREMFKANLENMDQRITEQNLALEKRFEDPANDTEDFSKDSKQNIHPLKPKDHGLDIG